MCDRSRMTATWNVQIRNFGEWKMKDVKDVKHYTPRLLEIVDTTLREGAQTSLFQDHYRYYFTQTDKVEIVQALIKYGVKFIELFSPIVSSQERDDISAIMEARDALVSQDGYARLLAHVRCHPADISAAIDAGFDGLSLFFGTSEISRRSTHGKDLDTLIRTARDLTEAVRADYPGLRLRFSGEDAFRTHEDDLFRVYDSVAPTVDCLGIPDTVGVATPATVAHRLERLRNRYPDVELEGHFHDDRGFSLVNALAAIECGVRYLNTTVLGIGERSGITSMTAVLYNLYINRQFDKVDGYRLHGSYPINVLVAEKLNTLVPPKEPVSLTNRTHTAGIHQKAVLSNAGAYEAHPLDRFGVSETEILLGPLSGWNLIYYFLKEIRYYQLDHETARTITEVFKERIYSSDPRQSPAELLEQIAEEEFKLERIETAKIHQGEVIQRLGPVSERRSDVKSPSESTSGSRIHPEVSDSG